VSPLWPALLATICAAIALRGFILVRDRGPVEERLVLTKEEETGRRSGPLTRLVDTLAGRLGPPLWRAASAKIRGRLARMLDRAGRPAGLTVEGLLGRCGAFALLGALGAGLLTLTGAGIAGLLLILLSVLGPMILLSRAGRMRQERLARDLPDFLDVLSVTVRAGLTYRSALGRVADALGGPMGEEATTTLRQMDLGATRRTAFISLRERNDCDALSSFVTAQLQAEELGVPLADTLNDITIDVRRSAHQNARRRAQRAAPRVSLIVTTLIVPASILLMVVTLFVGSNVDLGFLL